jgi:ATP-binding cassette subfamily B protein
MNKSKSNFFVKNNEVIPSTPFRFFIFITKQHKKWAYLAIGAVIVASSANAGSSYFFKLIIDAVEANNLNAAMQWGLLFPVAILFIQLTYRFSGYAGMNWTVGSNKTAMDILTKYLFRHSHGYFVDRFAGSITNKLRNVTGAFDEMIPDFLWAHLNAAVAFVVTFILILLVDVKSSLLFLFLILVLAIVNKRFAVKKAKVAKEYAEAGTVIQGRVADTFSNASTVRQYVQQIYEHEQLSELTTDKYNKGIINWFYTEKLLIANSFILSFFAIGMFWLLVTKWGEGQISTGDFVLVLALVTNITGSLLFIGRAFNATARTIGQLREGLDDILLPYEIEDVSLAKELMVTSAKIEWRSVNFNFTGVGVFEDFNLQIAPKQRLGLVGSSGAGKSTFVSLLLRQHELISGEILVDGQNIASVTQDSLRSTIALVPQEPMLFHRTIKENIAYSRPSATLDEVIEVAKKAQAHEFISRLPLGYDTMVGERGVKLSGGQKQRVAIARAMLKNAPILILDEATSALDSESEKEIQKALHILMEGKTVIAIAHRLSTLREMDRIIVLSEGKVIEDGKHEDLLKSSGQYSNLWSHQAGGFILE